MGEPVTYRMVAGPTLQGAFTEIHMDDVQVPSQYEARVLIRYDADPSRGTQSVAALPGSAIGTGRRLASRDPSRIAGSSM